MIIDDGEFILSLEIIYTYIVKKKLSKMQQKSPKDISERKKKKKRESILDTETYIQVTHSCQKKIGQYFVEENLFHQKNMYNYF